VASILASFYDEKNLMYKLLIKEKNILNFFEDLADKRNEVAHKHKTIEDDEKQKYYKNVIKVEQKIREIITIFLEGDR
jgi:phosphoglycerol transferase MdoB-like AlkP superfamily enzyme